MTFALAILDGKSATDAYKSAYAWQDSKPETIWANASRLRANPKVQAWLQAATISRLKRSSLTAEEHMAELAGIRDQAIQTKQYSVAVKAEIARGQVAGFYVSQYRDLTPAEKATDKELLETISRFLGISQEEVQQRINRGVLH
jgi:hypothetical protein